MIDPVDEKGQEPETQPPTEVRASQMLEALSSIVATQVAEHEIRQQELALRQRELDQNASYANKALDVQAQDRREHRDLFLKIVRDRYWFAIGGMLVIFIFMGWLVSHGQVELAKDILKLGLGFVAGGATGFFAGKAKRGNNSEQ
ncbi:hypothetical protein [Chitinolyticbacter meiyuanensis]|uniref:hypothetical protein n=1 Tax=Chitinolyticbacter meiyuanensis TaxID=682798 RepID=UPI0011E5E07B|nr:hypothetical protein [Chitinolyticbacter meiyuanensis]